MSRRTLTVFIDELAIEDGAMAPPQIGSIVDLVLDFTESAEPSRETMTIVAVLDLHTTNRRPDRDQAAGESQFWTGDLYGDGWRATWRGDRVLSGSVTLTGRLCHWHKLFYNPNNVVRGHVRRIQVVSIPYHAPTGDRWVPMVDGPRLYRDVEMAPRFFDRRALHSQKPAVEATIYGEIGILIDLGLDTPS
jgi:hypothetical protein